MNKQTEKARAELKWPVDKRINMRHMEQVVSEFIERCRSDAKKEAEDAMQNLRAENERLRVALAKARVALRRHVPHESFKAFKEDGRWFVHVGDDVCEVSEQAIELDAFDAIAQIDGVQGGEEGKEPRHD